MKNVIVILFLTVICSYAYSQQVLTNNQDTVAANKNMHQSKINSNKVDFHNNPPRLNTKMNLNHKHMAVVRKSDIAKEADTTSNVKKPEEAIENTGNLNKRKQ